MRISEFFYTEQQAAEVLGVTPITIWRWGKIGRFAVQRIGGTILIPKWEVELLKVTKSKKRRSIKA
jgi:excisionase family DNA binding protein